LTLPAAAIRGLNSIFLDFSDQPHQLKNLLAGISKGLSMKLDELEEKGFMRLNNDGTYVGSGGYGFTSELPAADFQGRVRCHDMWGFAESQVTVRVSPQMFEEFIFPLEKPLLDRFGLNCYGCCEPLHTRWHVVKRHHNLRRVSCSAWVDVEKMAGYLEDKYIFSMKVKPTIIASPNVVREAIRREIRSILERTRGCVVEIIMKVTDRAAGSGESRLKVGAEAPISLEEGESQCQRERSPKKHSSRERGFSACLRPGCRGFSACLDGGSSCTPPITMPWEAKEAGSTSAGSLRPPPRTTGRRRAGTRG
jgi:hypothetical protein